MRLIVAAAMFVLCLSGVARGEGLIYQLPPDGHWVSYTIDDQDTSTH